LEGNYPSLFVDPILVKTASGPSSNYSVHASEHNVNSTIKWVGKVKRGVYMKDRPMNDRYFAKFCLAEFGKNPRDLYTEYNLAVPNENAGFVSLFKYDKEQPTTLDMEKWATAGVWTERHFQDMRGSHVHTKLTDPENWQGLLEGLDRSTSSGFPWNSVCKTKGELFDYEEGRTFHEHFLKYWAGRCSSKVLWTNNVKREVRSVEKIEQNKLRTFVGSPSEHVVACKAAFDEMNERFYASHRNTWSFVGATKYMRGADRLFRRLNKHGKAYALDESEYDSSLFREIMFGICEMRKHFLHEDFNTEEIYEIIDNLYREIVESLIVTTSGDVVMKETGNPSGSANTIVDNTLALFRLLAYAWLKVCPPEMSEYSDFMENVEAALNGDDNTFTVSDEADKFFNGGVVAAIWKEIGIKARSECSPDFSPKKLEEVDFLSFNWRFVAGYYVPVPETQKVLASLAYNNKCGDNPRWSLLRAYALRIESFFNDECRRTIDKYILWLRKHHMADLMRPLDSKDPNDVFTLGDVESVYKTDHEIMRLYIMEEGAPDFRTLESKLCASLAVRERVRHIKEMNHSTCDKCIWCGKEYKACFCYAKYKEAKREIKHDDQPQAVVKLIEGELYIVQGSKKYKLQGKKRVNNYFVKLLFVTLCLIGQVFCASYLTNFCTEPADQIGQWTLYQTTLNQNYGFLQYYASNVSIVNVTGKLQPGVFLYPSVVVKNLVADDFSAAVGKGQSLCLYYEHGFETNVRFSPFSQKLRDFPALGAKPVYSGYSSGGSAGSCHNTAAFSFSANLTDLSLAWNGANYTVIVSVVDFWAYDSTCTAGPSGTFGMVPTSICWSSSSTVLAGFGNPEDPDSLRCNLFNVANCNAASASTYGSCASFNMVTPGYGYVHVVMYPRSIYIITPYLNVVPFYSQPSLNVSGVITSATVSINGTVSVQGNVGLVDGSGIAISSSNRLPVGDTPTQTVMPQVSVPGGRVVPMVGATLTGVVGSLPVSVVGSSTQYVTNITGVPVVVEPPTTVAVSVVNSTVSVKGALDQDEPLWVTAKKVDDHFERDPGREKVY
jgi:hypothetical protein